MLTGPDAPRAAELAGAMPPVCRAGEPGGQPPGPLLTAALDALADAAARARLDTSAAGPQGSAAQARGRRGKETARHETARHETARHETARHETARHAAAQQRWGLLPPRRGRRPARVPVAERWAAALTGPDAEVEVASAEDEAEAAELAAALDAWRAAVQAPAGPVRTCFRLVEPAPQDAVQQDLVPQDAVPQDLMPQDPCRRTPSRKARCRKTRCRPRRTSPPTPPATPGTSSSPSSRPRIPA